MWPVVRARSNIETQNKPTVYTCQNSMVRESGHLKLFTYIATKQSDDIEVTAIRFCKPNIGAVVDYESHIFVQSVQSLYSIKLRTS
jgi:hypothetical protein